MISQNKNKEMAMIALEQQGQPVVTPYQALLRQIPKIPTKAGFFDIPNLEASCLNPGHNPPSFLHIPNGKGYRHVCPACGHVTTVIPKNITF